MGESVSHVGLMSLNTTKAGMEGLDKEKINQIINDASKGSKFYAKKQADQARIDRQVEDMKGSLASLDPADLARAMREADQVVSQLRKGRDLSRTIVHVDMDMFYAAVEMQEQPSLKDVPMAVGGMGMLSTSNYRARKFGVRAAMPGFIAKKLCPELVIVPSNMEKYAAVSEVVRSVFREYDPNFSPMSLDEAYLDLTDQVDKLGLEDREEAAATLVRRMRAEITERTGGLTASAGIACNTLLAKVCSDLNKPDGQFQLEPKEENIIKFMADLSIRKVGGVGNVSEQLLKAVGIETCSDLYGKRAQLKLLFSELSFEFYMQVSQGLGSTTILAPDERERKSISQETTFRDTSEREQLVLICRQLSNSLAADMAAKNIVGQAVTVKVKTHDFKLKTKVAQLAESSNSEQLIFSTACSVLVKILDSLPDQPPALRLMGVRMSELRDKAELVGRAKQTSLLTFLGEAGGLNNNYTCPVCQVNCATLASLNQHIDNCIQEDGSDKTALGACDLVKDETNVSHQLEPIDVKSNLTGFFSKKIGEVAFRDISACIALESTSSATAEPIQPPQWLQSSINSEHQTSFTKQQTYPTSDQPTSSTSELQSSTSPPTSSSTSCPVCLTSLPSNDEESCTRHVEDCLSRHEVREMLRQEGGGGIKRKGVSEQIVGRGVKRKGGSGGGGVKRCKVSQESCTIDLFFNKLQ